MLYEVITAKPLQPIEPLPPIQPFEAMPFHPTKSRSPFSEPHPEGMFTPVSAKRRDCAQPDPGRKKDELEQFSLDNLMMRGTMEGVINSYSIHYTKLYEWHP